MRSPYPIIAIVAWTLSGCADGTQNESARSEIDSFPTDSVVTNIVLDSRQEFLKDNIEFQLRDNLEGRSIIIGPIADSEFDGFDKGSFTVGREMYHFLVTEDDERIVFLAKDPFETLTGEERAAILEEKAREARQDEEQRLKDLAEAVNDAPARGDPAAAVTVVEFSDFECPYCKRGFDTVEQLLEKHGDDIRFVYLHYPLNFHPWAEPSAVASVCAAEQDHEAFWTLHDFYFRNQDEMEAENVVEKSRTALQGSGLDLVRWESCAADTSSEAHQEALAVVGAQADLAVRMGVTGTPGFFVNGRFISGAQPLERFEEAIEEAKREG